MAKQAGIILLRGTMGGISFYKRNGKHLARKAAGPDRSRIMNDPKFERTRENNTEFAGVQFCVSSFNKIFNTVKNFKDATFHGRVAKILHSIKERADGIRGQRSIEISKKRELIHGLELNSNTALHNSFYSRFNATHNTERTKGTIDVTNIEIFTGTTSIPLTATHFKLIQLLAVVSDVAYNADLKKYTPLDAANNSIHNLSMTDYMSVSNEVPMNITLDATLTPAAPLGDNVSVLQCLGILFYDKVGLEYFPTTQGKAMKIVDVF